MSKYFCSKQSWVMISILPHRQRRRNRRTTGQLTTQKELSQSHFDFTTHL